MADYCDDDVYDGYADLDEQTRALIELQREQARMQLEAAFDDQNYADDEEQEEQEETAPAQRRARVAPASSGKQSKPSVGGTTSQAGPGVSPSAVIPKQSAPKTALRRSDSASRSEATIVSPRNRKQPSTAAAADGATAPKPKRTTKRKEKKKILNCATSKYAIIRELASDFGFVQEDDETVEKYGFNLLWADTIMPLQKVARLANWQRFNHFPSMHLLCRKGHLGLTLGRMRKTFAEEYSFFPRTWTLRSEKSHFARHLQTLQGMKRPVFIMKPNAGCQGRGIILTRDPLNATEDVENFVVQEYMSKPLLIEGKKFDLRVYVLVTSIRHLSVMVFPDGLVRICADPYQRPTDANLANTCIHLTNYAVNKHSENFVFNKDGNDGSSGNKRDFKFLNEWLASEGHDVTAFWGRVDDMIVKTLIAALPKMQHVYNSCFPHGNDGYTCFEVLGIDVLVDEKLRPWLLEVNHTPSFHCDTPLDHRIKHGLLKEVWEIINVNGNDRQRNQIRERALRNRRLALGDSTTDGMLVDGEPVEAVDPAAVVAAEDSRCKLFRRAYPPADPVKKAKYDALIKGAREVNEDVKITAAQEARVAEVRAERALREAKLEVERAFIPTTSSSNLLSPAAAASSSSSFFAAPAQPSVSLPTASMTNTGNTPLALSSSACLPGFPTVPPIPAARTPTTSVESAAAVAKMWASQLRSSAVPPSPSPPTVPLEDGMTGATRGRTTTTARRRTGDALPDSPASGGPSNTAVLHHAAASAPPRVLRSLGSNNATISDSLEETSALPRPRPVPPGAQQQQQQQPSAMPANGRRAEIETKILRDRVAEQMEKHRRRMVLGPRLSVFQLRDSQIDFADDQAIAPSIASLNAADSAAPQAPAVPASTSRLLHQSPAIPMRSCAGASLPTALPPASVNTGHATSSRVQAAPVRTMTTLFGSSEFSNAEQPPPGSYSFLPASSSASSSAVTKAQGNNTAVAISAATLQHHWLYHYDS